MLFLRWRVFLMGMSWLFILFLFKFLSQRYRRLLFLRSIGPITVTILGIAIVNIWHLQRPPASIPVVGKIPKGLPDFTVVRSSSRE
jgi:sulfate transporter 4